MVLLKTELPCWRWRYGEILKFKCIFGEQTLAKVEDFEFRIFGFLILKLQYLGGGGGGGGCVGARRHEFTPSPMKPGLKNI